MPGHTDPFRLETLYKASATKFIHRDIAKHRLDQEADTGKAIGCIARNCCLREEFLYLFVQIMVTEWKIRGGDWKSNVPFLHGVQDGYKSSVPDLSNDRQSSFQTFVDSLSQYLEKHVASPTKRSMNVHALEQPPHPQPAVGTSGIVTTNEHLDNEYAQIAPRLKSKPFETEQSMPPQRSYSSERNTVTQDEVRDQEASNLKQSKESRWRTVQGFGHFTVRVLE